MVAIWPFKNRLPEILWFGRPFGHFLSLLNVEENSTF